MLCNKCGNPLNENTLTCDFCSKSDNQDNIYDNKTVAADNADFGVNDNKKTKNPEPETIIYTPDANTKQNISEETVRAHSDDYQDDFSVEIVHEAVDEYDEYDDDDEFEENTYGDDYNNCDKDEQAFATADFDEPAKSKKKNKKRTKAIVLSIISFVLIIVILFVSFNFTYVLGHLIRLFCSDATYLKFVEGLNIKETSQKASTIYSTSAQYFSSDYEKTTDVKLFTLSDLLSMFGGFNLFGNNSGGGGLDLNLDPESDTITLDQTSAETSLTAAQDDKIEFKLPDFSDESTKEKLESLFDNDYTEILENDSFNDALPDSKQIKDLSIKYAKIICDEITDEHVDASYKDVKVSDIEQELYVIEFKLDYKTYCAMRKSALAELREDEEVKVIIDDLAAALEKEKYIKDADTVYTDFISYIDETISEIDKSLKTTKNELVFTLVDYVNCDHQIVGRDFIVDGKKSFSYIAVVSDGTFKFNSLSEGDKDFVLSGSGTIVDDVVKGDFKLTLGEELFFEIKLSNYDIKKAEDGYLNAKLDIKPSESFLKSIIDIPAIQLANPKITVNLSCDESAAKLEAKVVVLTKDLISLSYKATKSEN